MNPFLLLLMFFITFGNLSAQDKFEATFRDKERFYNLALERSEGACGTSDIQCVVKKFQLFRAKTKKSYSL